MQRSAMRFVRVASDRLLHSRFECAWVALALFVLTLGTQDVNAEGSRTLFPSTYSAAGFRADLDVTSAANLYAGVTARRQFIYVYAQAGEFVELGSSNRANGGDILVYNPQSFGVKANETVPTTANFTCSAATPPLGSFSGGTLGQIAARVNELAGPNSADNSVTNTNGYAPCAYLAPQSGVYGVLFTAATTGGSGPSGAVDPLHVGSATVAAWDVTVRSGVKSVTDINARMFTYGLIAFTGGNGRPIYHTLYYATLDGARYKQDMEGLDPNGYALWANASAFLDEGQPLYKDLRGNSNLVNAGYPTEITTQLPQDPIFVSTIDPAGANAAQATLVLQALGIPAAPPTPILNNPVFSGAQSGSQTYVGGGGTFTFNTQNDTSYLIVVSAGVDYDPGNPANVTLSGLAPDGANSVVWNGLNNSGTAFPTGTFNYRIVGRNGEVHFPIIDAEGNSLGGPVVTKLNGVAGDQTVYYDDRGYQTRDGVTVGTLNGLLCPASPPIPPTADHSLLGVNSSANTATGANCNNGGGGTCYYRYWPGNANTNGDCTGAFGDAKALDLWTYQQTNPITTPLVINAPPAAATVKTTVSVPSSSPPNATVNGSLTFQNVGTTAATGVAYSAVIGTPGNCPTNLAFSVVPTGVTFTYNAATCAVTFSGLPTTLLGSQDEAFNFSYTSPNSGTVPVKTTVTSTNGGSSTATGTTNIIAADVTTTVSVPATAAGLTTVSGTITYSNAATATSSASNVTYGAVIGTPGSCPTAVTFPTLPSGVTATYNSSSCQVSFAGATTTLTAGQTLTVGFQYSGPNAGTVPVSTSIATSTAESNAANDSATGSTVFAPVTDLSITKTDNIGGRYTPGGTATYTLKVSNAGPSTAIGASILDNLPNGVKLTGPWTCTATSGSSCAAASGGASGGSTVSLNATLAASGVVTVLVPVAFSSNPASY